ncbi:MAG: DNA mismatch repair endonuclease MutL [Anaerolineae bacterium]|nr:DNA mismatch repair endonuclease MutL [Anaerolineae bacterium]MDW8099804.1 DNA mismatch repair endonuclease MutL [Anaerolineae bacterium]
MPIRVLPPEIASKIAAGEVIERPASVVKELVENSLDAGADEVRVEIAEGGRRLIRVMDNGHGIPADEVELAFARHATSKLQTAEDLERIRTLGFRGEALGSIAAVAHVTMLTRYAHEAIGTQIRLQGGVVVGRELRGAPVGTVVTVEHLFYNMPARLKFLRQPASEAGHVQALVHRLALAFPERRFSLISDGRLLFQSTGSGELQEVLLKAYGLEVAREMIPIEPQEHDGVRVHGYVSQPSLHRAHRSYLTLFVNRRWVHDTSLSRAIVQAYHTMLPQGRFPIAVVFLELPPEAVDVNVHPAKAEVRFRNARSAFHAVERAVRQTLVTRASVPAVGRLGPEMPSWAERRQILLQAGQSASRQSSLSLSQPLDTDTKSATPIAVVTSKPSPAIALPMLRVVGQVSASYIIAEGPDGMYLIDQHAAHERILYEQLMAQRAQGDVPSQRLLEPLPITLPPALAALAGQAREALASLGLEIEPFGANTFLVRTLPAILSRGDPREILENLIQSLEEERNRVTQAEEEALVRLICKRAAIKAGQPLSMAEMQELVRQLETCQTPHTCPHGRPTMIHISAEQLAREFGRR